MVIKSTMNYVLKWQSNHTLITFMHGPDLHDIVTFKIFSTNVIAWHIVNA